MATAGRGLGQRRRKPFSVRAGGRPGQPSGGRCVPTSASGRGGAERGGRCLEPAVRAWQLSLEGGGPSEVWVRGPRPGAT